MEHLFENTEQGFEFIGQGFALKKTNDPGKIYLYKFTGNKARDLEQKRMEDKQGLARKTLAINFDR